MSSEKNKDVVRLLMEAFEAGKFNELLGTLVSPNAVVHMPGGERLGVAEWLEEEAAYLTAFPDGRMAIEAQVAEGDTVATLITFRGTQRGDLRGIPATGKVVELSGILWSRVLEGVIVEHREEYNLLGLMQQLDAMPMEGEG